SGYDKDDLETVWSVGANSKPYADSLIKDGLKGKRVGVLKSFFGKDDIHTDVTNIVNSRIAQMKDGGAILIDIDEEIDSEYLVKNVSVHLHDLKDHLDTYLSKIDDSRFASSTKEVLESGRHHQGIKENLETAMSLSTDSYEYFKRLAKQEKEKTKLLKLFIDYNLDAIVYPHQKQLVCKVGGSQKERNGVLASVTGFPSICVQAGFSRVNESAPIGVPIGMEIMGKPFTEEILIEIAYSLEQLESKRVSPPFAK
ncbi:MAG: amidase family protein, partial [Acidaminobacteraceae bacterium]